MMQTVPMLVLLLGRCLGSPASTGLPDVSAHKALQVLAEAGTLLDSGWPLIEACDADTFQLAVRNGYSAHLLGAALAHASFGQTPPEALTTNRPTTPQVCLHYIFAACLAVGTCTQSQHARHASMSLVEPGCLGL